MALRLATALAAALLSGARGAGIIRRASGHGAIPPPALAEAEAVAPDIVLTGVVVKRKKATSEKARVCVQEKGKARKCQDMKKVKDLEVLAKAVARWSAQEHVGKGRLEITELKLKKDDVDQESKVEVCDKNDCTETQADEDDGSEKKVDKVHAMKVEEDVAEADGSHQDSKTDMEDDTFDKQALKEVKKGAIVVKKIKAKCTGCGSGVLAIGPLKKYVDKLMS
mmetsp:Transcript_100647/g.280372  ORF Transcript_100647/g.280372 Transcript_100647/m.280372 type:complete len:224 (+) Transcript_100647:73-744(+)